MRLTDGVTVRAILVGAAGACIESWFIPYANLMVKGSYMGLWFTASAAIFFFVLLVGLVNPLLGRIHRRLALERGELAVVYIMLIIANAIPSWGFTEFLLPILTGAFYFAAPENQWMEEVWQYIPDWMVPARELDQIRDFYEGALTGGGIPWSLWIVPLVYWLLFALALYVAMACAMIILRKQWGQYERLAFPMVQLPLQMIQDDETRSPIKPFFKRPLMWCGFTIPFFIGMVNGLHHYYPFVPRISIGWTFDLFRGTFTLPLSVSWPMLGFSYFIQRDVAFGLCFFVWLNTFENGLFTILGIGGREAAMGVYSGYTDPILIHQSVGAMIVLVLFGLWVGRSHLKDVFSKAFRRDETVDDSDEVLSYRKAVIGLFMGLTGVGLWMYLTGLSLWLSVIFVVVAFIFFIAMTRVVAEGGVCAMFPPTNAPDVVISGFGIPALGTDGIVALGFSYIWATDMLTFVMVPCANGLKLAAEQIRTRIRWLFVAILISIVCALAASTWTVLHYAYQYGGINLNGYFFQTVPHYVFDFISKRLSMDSGPNILGWIHTTMGAGVMVLLMLAHHRFLWWPLHPLGFPISSVFASMWFSVFIAWIVKSIVLKYGGPPLYRRLGPFFLGLIIGQIVVAGLWIFIDGLTGSQGNVIYTQ